MKDPLNLPNKDQMAYSKGHSNMQIGIFILLVSVVHQDAQTV
jgi:hypothetical protein